MKEILSIVLSTFVFILAIPLAYGQQLDTTANLDTVDTSNCEFRIYPKESKSCVLNITDSPFLKSKSETSEQDRLRTPIG